MSKKWFALSVQKLFLVAILGVTLVHLALMTMLVAWFVQQVLDGIIKREVEKIPGVMRVHQ